MSATIISVATTGAWPGKEDNPAVPITPEEIAKDVIECYHAGASVAHLHMRDEQGRGSMDKDLFKKTVDLIRSECDILINLTTSGALDATNETRQAHLRLLRPDLASYDAGTMNWMHAGIFENHPAFLEELGMTMQEIGVKPEIEVFDTSFLYNALYYQSKGVLKSPLFIQFVLGAPGGIAATVENLVFLKNLLPEDAVWSAFGIGKNHLPILYATLALGGHIRVGMEDNVMYRKGELATSNAQFVRRAVRIIEEMDRKVATVEEAANILGVRK